MKVYLLFLCGLRSKKESTLFFTPQQGRAQLNYPFGKLKGLPLRSSSDQATQRLQVIAQLPSISETGGSKLLVEVIKINDANDVACVS